MATYVLLSKLTEDGAETITGKPDRIREVNQELANLGVTVREQYALLGPYDFINIVDAPDNATIMRVSALLSARGSVQITTLPAVPLDDFIASLKR
jgi:uncharacterized protein with GYD domain